MRHTGVTARGIVSPIFKEGDDLAKSICESVLNTASAEGFAVEDGDIIGITESVVARTQGNYVTCEQIASDIQAKFGGGSLGIVFPILSRNRFSILLKSIAQACDKLYIQLSYPADEVGNELVSWEQIENKDVDPYRDYFTEKDFRRVFGHDTVHPFTGMDYIQFYKSFGEHIEVIFSNNPADILKYTDKVLCCDIHTRHRTKRTLTKQGASKVLGLDDILNESIDGSGYNADYGLLGSNMATPDKVKLFPRDSQALVDNLQKLLKDATEKNVEVLVYGDGCFKDPVGGIWEFADPVVAPGYTKGLMGTPNEIKMKYLADNDLCDLSGEALRESVLNHIRKKDHDLVGKMAAQGTTPRRYTDLLGSLCDLVSGSGDRGTPVVYIKGYFTNYASE